MNLDTDDIISDEQMELDDEPVVNVRQNPVKDKIVGSLVPLVGDVVLFFTAFFVGIILEELVSTKVNGFFKDDHSISLPYLDNETVPIAALLSTSFGIPLLTFLVVDILTWIRFMAKRSKRTVQTRYLVQNSLHNVAIFLFGMISVWLVTTWTKKVRGKLRPDFIGRCDPDYSQVSPDVEWISPDMQSSVCQGPESVILEGRKSFISGHSSIICFTMLYSILYMETILVPRRFVIAKPFFQVLLFAYAVFVCMSRITDHVHAGIDVLGGSLFGVVIAVCFDRLRRNHEYSMKSLWLNKDKSK